MANAPSKSKENLFFFLIYLSSVIQISKFISLCKCKTDANVCIDRLNEIGKGEP